MITKIIKEGNKAIAAMDVLNHKVDGMLKQNKELKEINKELVETLKGIMEGYRYLHSEHEASQGDSGPYGDDYMKAEQALKKVG